jgi:hypothetical protein
MQQALYNASAYFTLQGVNAEAEIREQLRLPTFLLAGLLFIAVSLPVLDSAKLGDLRPLEDTYQDLNLSEIAAHLATRLPADHKQDSYKLAKLLLQLSERHMLSPGLILSVIETESSYRYSIVSNKGAVGLMQLLPDTAREVAQMYHIRSYRTEEDLLDPAVNLRLGAAYLSYLRGRFGNSLHYLAAYNMGPTAMRTRLKNGNYELGAVEAYVRNIQERTLKLRENDSSRIAKQPSMGRSARGVLLADAL